MIKDFWFEILFPVRFEIFLHYFLVSAVAFCRFWCQLYFFSCVCDLQFLSRFWNFCLSFSVYSVSGDSFFSVLFALGFVFIPSFSHSTVSYLLGVYARLYSRHFHPTSLIFPQFWKMIVIFSSSLSSVFFFLGILLIWILLLLVSSPSLNFNVFLKKNSLLISSATVLYLIF